MAWRFNHGSLTERYGRREILKFGEGEGEGEGEVEVEEKEQERERFYVGFNCV